MRCFRTGDAHDPQVFLTAIVTVMTHYPVDVVAEVCDPYRGIPGKQNWIPTPFEVRKACDDIMLPRLKARERDRRINSQLEERKRIEDKGGLRHQTWDEVKSEMAGRGIFFSHSRPQAIETAETVKAKLKITDAEWNAIPNAPTKAST